LHPFSVAKVLPFALIPPPLFHCRCDVKYREPWSGQHVGLAGVADEAVLALGQLQQPLLTAGWPCGESAGYETATSSLFCMLRPPPTTNPRWFLIAHRQRNPCPLVCSTPRFDCSISAPQQPFERSLSIIPHARQPTLRCLICRRTLLLMPVSQHPVISPIIIGQLNGLAIDQCPAR
jgi:hypothetical protein